MTTYIVRRLLGLIPVLIGISLLIFTITRLIPGDPATLILGQRATEASLARVRQNLGLNEPLFFNVKAVAQTGNPLKIFDAQYFTFMASAITGDFGRSIYSRVPVLQSLLTRFPATFELTLTSMLFALIIGIPAGVIAALRRGTLADTSVLVLALSGVSFPVFWLAIILIYVFAV
ncbi:MAG TPA: ABC transporter permease, partial [Trueperaceae bacterium]